MTMQVLPLLLLACCTTGCRVQSADLAAERATLLAINAHVGKAHFDRDPAAFLSAVESGWWSAANGAWTYRDKATASKELADYFAHTTFEDIRDVTSPDVHVSGDGSTAWLRGEVEIRGATVDSRGVSQPLRFRAAWLDVYEKRQGHWVLVAKANTQRAIE